MSDRGETTEGGFRAEPELLEGIVETSPIGIVAVDGDGMLTFVNERAEEIYGRSREEIDEFDHDDSRWDLVDDDGEPLEAGEAPFDRVVEQGKAIYDQVIGLRRPSGERVWVSVNGAPQWNEDGELERAVFAFEDITESRQRERELEQYETIIESINEGVYVVDAKRDFQWVNEAYAELLGYSREELIGENATTIVDDEVIREAEEIEQEQGYEELPRMDVELLTKSGDRIPVDASSTVLPEGEEDGWFRAGIVRDVTERKEHARALEESERRYRTLVENFPNGAVALFDDDLRYTVAGGEILEEVGTSEQEIVGKTVWERYPEELASQLEPNFRAALDGETNSLEFELYDRHWLAYTLPVTNDAGDVFAGMMMVQDITDRREYERELERALDLLEKTERIADVAGWEVDPDTREPYWSDHLFDLLDVDYDEQPSLEEALDVYHTEEDRAIVEDAVEEALETGAPFDVTVRFPRPSGDVGWLRVQGDPAVEDGEVVTLRGAVQDVTERKKREQQLEELVDRLEESNERLEQFAYATSHDLQEPLRMVSSYLQLIEDRYSDALDEDGKEFLEFAVDSADRMREMIEGLLQYSRVETEGDPVEPVDLNTVLDDVLADLRLQIEEHDADVTVDDLPCVEGDGGQLHQVFQNLLDNAIEYSGDEPPRVHVSAERDGPYWRISVRDEGIGIDPEQQDRVFEVFQRLHSREGHDGTGIGLALCERIVERHGGEIWVDAEPGEGSTFTFTLPAGQEWAEE